MTVAVRYQSRGGNTKAVAEAIAAAADVTAQPLDVPLDGAADLLFVGGGVYGGNIDAALAEFLGGLDAERVKSAAIFSTTGGTNSAYPKMAAIFAEKGIPTRPDPLLVRFGVRNLAFLGGKGFVTLSPHQTDKIEAFVKAALNR